MNRCFPILVVALILISGCTIWNKYRVDHEIIQELHFPAGYKVAVLPFTAPSPGTKDLTVGTITTFENSGDIVADAVSSALLGLPDITVVERAQIQRIFREHELSLSDFVKEPDFTTIGRILPVDALVMGNVSAYDLWISGGVNWGCAVGFNGRMVDTDSGKVLFTFHCHASKHDGVADAMAFDLAKDVVKRIRKDLDDKK